MFMLTRPRNITIRDLVIPPQSNDLYRNRTDRAKDLKS